MLPCTYGLAAVIDVMLFDFVFLRDTPFYLASLQETALVSLAPAYSRFVLYACAALLSVAMFALYRAARTKQFGLASGTPKYHMELWVAWAMLAITFPLMVVFEEFSPSGLFQNQND